MKLSKFIKDYHEFSGKASDISRHLAFAGIAIIWIFRINNTDSISIPDGLLLPLVLMVLTLSFDLFQYIAAAIVWGIFQWLEERKLDDPKINPDIDAPAWLKRPQFTFFVLKLFTIIAGYYFLLKYLFIKLI